MSQPTNPQDEIRVLREILGTTRTALEDKINELSLLRIVNEILALGVVGRDQFRRIVSHVARLINATGGSVWLRHGDQIACITEDRTPIDIGQGILGWVARTGEPQVLSDAPVDPRADIADGVRSLAAFPLVFQGEVLGVIALHHADPDIFGDSDIRLLNLLSGQLGVAIKNIDLFRNLSEAHNHHQNLIDSSVDAIVATDPDLNIVLANTGAELLWGSPRELLAGTTLGRRIDGGEQLASVAQQVLASGEAVEGRRCRLRPSGGSPVDVAVSCSPVRNTEGNIEGTIAILTDLSERVRLEAQLISSESMASKGRMAAEVGHELGNYINAVGGHAALLPLFLEEGDVDGAMERADLICDQVERIARFAHGLMNLSHLDQRVRPTQLENLARETIEFLQPQKLYDEVRFVLDLESAPALIDPAHVQQVLVNLVKNAAEATGDSAIEIRVSTGRDGTESWITVEDDGVGIPESMRDELFDMGCTGRQDGHGLGLSICKRIVINHGGSIECEAGTDQGTRMIVRFPDQGAKAASAPEEVHHRGTGA